MKPLSLLLTMLGLFSTSHAADTGYVVVEAGSGTYHFTAQ